MARGGSRPGAGRPKGSGNQKHNELREMLFSQAEPLVAQLIKQARDGDIQAIKLCMDKILPSIKPVNSPINIDFDSAESLTEKAELILAAAASGQMSSTEANQLLASITSLAQIVEFEEFDKRLADLEKQAEMVAPSKRQS